MSYENRTTYKNLDIEFEYKYDSREDCLQVESWTAFDEDGKEYQIIDSNASLEIEVKIRNLLEDRLDLLFDARDDYSTVKDERAFDRYRDNFILGD